MRRRAPNETVEPWRLRINGAEAHELGDRLRDWSNERRYSVTWPEMPAGIEDRNADVWEALLAVADLAGGDWPERARCSAVTLVTQSADRTGSLGVTLLRDLKAIFEGIDKLPTEAILDRLHDIEESPWADLRGKPLDSRGLSRRLSKYGVKPKPQRVGGDVFRGYDAADLADPWSRYVTAETGPFGKLPDPPPVTGESGGQGPEDAVTSVTPQQGGFFDNLRCSACRDVLDEAARLVQARTCTACEIKELSA
jgi:hypothetical protein